MRPRLLILALAALPILIGAAMLRPTAPPAERGTLYTANLRSSDISAIDLATGKEAARVPVAENPHEFTGGLGNVWVSNYRSARVTVFGHDLHREVPVPGEPHGLAVSGSHIAVTQGRAGRVSLVDSATGEIVSDIETGGEPHMLTASANRLYVVDAANGVLLELDPAQATVTRRVAVGQTPESVAVSPDGGAIAVANARSFAVSLVDMDSFVERARIAVPGAPVRVAYSPDGRTLAVSLQDTGFVLLLDPITGKVRASIKAGERPDGLAFSSSGRLLYVALTGEQRVAVLDLKQRRVTGHLSAGDGPSGLLLVP